MAGSGLYFSEKRLRKIKQWYADNIRNDEIADILMTVRFLIHQMEEVKRTTIHTLHLSKLRSF